MKISNINTTRLWQAMGRASVTIIHLTAILVLLGIFLYTSYFFFGTIAPAVVMIFFFFATFIEYKFPNP
jgi:hypothetical protein